MEETPLSININGIRFTLIEKTVLSNGYIVVHIRSLNLTTDENANFWVYRSKSELGFWRFGSSISDTDTGIYKGEVASNYDYIQTTFIHLQLQFFININITNDQLLLELQDIIKDEIEKGVLIKTKANNVPIDHNNKTKKDDIVKKITDHNLFAFNDNKTKNQTTIYTILKPIAPEHKIIINSQDRIIMEAPFIDLYHTAKCGDQSIDNYEKDIFGLSRKLEKLYEIPKEEVQLFEYNNTFEEKIEITGHVCSINMLKKTPIVGSYINDITIYYLKASLCKINKDIVDDYEESINKVCDITEHIMPFLLIPNNSVINILGLYSHYILAGSYICKLFDYIIQCSKDEILQCTINYNYIGARFNRIFPYYYFIHIPSILGKNKKLNINSSSKKGRRSSNAEGTTKKGNQSKRKTRKQQNKERNKRKEINKRKERRSKNKNKSKKYGVRSL